MKPKSAEGQNEVEGGKKEKHAGKTGKIVDMGRSDRTLYRSDGEEAGEIDKKERNSSHQD